MKKMFFIIFLVASIVFTSSFSVIASSDTTTYKVSGHLSAGDSIVISSTDVEPNNAIPDNKVNFEGYLFTGGSIERQAIQKANIRSGPGKSFNIVRSIRTGDIVNVIGVFAGIGNEWSWYLLEDGTYTASHLFTKPIPIIYPIEIDDFDEDIDEDIEENIKYYSCAKPKQALQEANVRTGPGTKFDIMYTLSSGDIVNAVGICDGVGCDWPWYLLEDGYFVSAHLLGDI